MILYFAGHVFDRRLEADMFEAGLKNRLYTYWEISGEIGKHEIYQEHLKRTLSKGKVFIDSGAFSAYTHQSSVDLDAYQKYLKTIKGNVACACTLDVIGDFKATQRNYKTMIRSRYRFPILNVVHYGSTDKQIEAALSDLKEKYICVGGLVPHIRRPRLLMAFLDRFWRIAKTWKGLRVHALGVMNYQILARYPFYSSDSTSAIVGAGMGRVMRFSNGYLKSHHYKDQRKATHQTIHLCDDGKTHHAVRRIYNVKAQLQMQEHLTRLWAERGIVW